MATVAVVRGFRWQVAQRWSGSLLMRRLRVRLPPCQSGWCSPRRPVKSLSLNMWGGRRAVRFLHHPLSPSGVVARWQVNARMGRAVPGE